MENHTKQTVRNLLIVLFSFIILAQALYTYQNMRMFDSQHTRQTNEQVRELGEIIHNEIYMGLKYKIPIERLGRVNVFLKRIVEDTPTVAFIDIIKADEVLFSAARERDYQHIIQVPISNPDGEPVGIIKLGISRETRRQSGRILFDLFTIVMVGLIITRELLVFFTSRMLRIPEKETRLASNSLLHNLEPFAFKINSRELSFFLREISGIVESIRQRVAKLEADVNVLAHKVRGSTQIGKEHLLELIQNQKSILTGLKRSQIDFMPVIDPAHVRPLVFIFILAANLHASFLPFFAKDLLGQATFLSGRLPEKILMGAPISCYMITVTVTMMFMGSRFLISVRPLQAVTLSCLFTAVGLILCGLAHNILDLILARMLCAVGFAIIVLYGRQFIVDHSDRKSRTFYLAGYTTAFSGGLFCSIIIGGIMADYYSYRMVFFAAAAMMLFVIIFAYLVFAHQPPPDAGVEKSVNTGLIKFMATGIRDRNLMAVMAHGMITRVMFVGFYYFCIPLFLKAKFTYSDMGRIMMFYGLVNILLATFLNKDITKTAQSKQVVVVSNIILGLALSIFYFITFDDTWRYMWGAIGSLVVLGLSNSLTFPSQVNLLLETQTAHRLGNHRTCMAVYQSVERIGSALGPLFFGLLATVMSIEKAIGVGGVLYTAANILFFFAYKKDETPAV